MIDIQSGAGHSRFRIESVGVTGLKYPIAVRDRVSGEIQQTVATWRMGVSLEAEKRGTHMSRFIDELEKRAHEPMDLDDHYRFAQLLQERLETRDTDVQTSFVWFRRMKAPVSRREGFIDCHVEFRSSIGAANEKILGLKVPAKALCPCSKAISDRGAHNQRSDISVYLHLPEHGETPSLEKLAVLIDGAASSPVYPILKREDEKYVTEAAYDNPVFAEDIVRNVAERLYDLPVVTKFSIEAVNRESIHAHDCYARVVFER